MLLIDADLRRPRMHEMFALPNERRPERQPAAAARRPAAGPPRLADALGADGGPADSDPMSALVSDTMKQLLTKRREQFDWVIVDTPPVALLPDANLLAAMIDTALLVVSASTTPYPLVQRAVDGDRRRAHPRRRAESRRASRMLAHELRLLLRLLRSRRRDRRRRPGGWFGLRSRESTDS